MQRLRIGGKHWQGSTAFGKIVKPTGSTNCLLFSCVALELKIGEFEPEYIGKMQFYLSVLDDTVRLSEEQPSIGIILCKSKDRLIVEYALKDATLPIGVSSYSVPLAKAATQKAMSAAAGRSWYLAELRNRSETGSITSVPLGRRLAWCSCSRAS